MQGNGVDIAAVYQLLPQVASKVSEIDIRLTAFQENATREIAQLRETVVLYQHAVVGHGMQFSELERRILRVERQLGLPPLDPGDLLR